MEGIVLSIQLLALLGVANLAPLVARRLLRARWLTPLDGGLSFFDGRRLLGPSKTVRGLLAAVIAAALCAPLVGISIDLGALIGATAMAGDALSSFVKRRLGIAPSAEAIGLDHIPESLLPLLAVKSALSLSLLQIVGVTAAFVAFGIPLARMVRRRHERKRGLNEPPPKRLRRSPIEGGATGGPAKPDPRWPLGCAGSMRRGSVALRRGAAGAA